MSRPIVSRPIATLLAVTLSTGLALVPAVMAQSAATGDPAPGWPPRTPPAPASVVSQLGLSGSKAGQVQQVLEQRQAAWNGFREAIRSSHARLRQLLTPEQLRQLYRIEYPHALHPAHGHHLHAHGAAQDTPPAAAGSAG